MRTTLKGFRLRHIFSLYQRQGFKTDLIANDIQQMRIYVLDDQTISRTCRGEMSRLILTLVLTELRWGPFFFFLLFIFKVVVKVLLKLC